MLFVGFERKTLRCVVAEMEMYMPDNKSQGIVRTGRGEEQPADKERAQMANQTRKGEPSPSQQATRKDEGTMPPRSGHSTK